jgi:putative oxidoreductase
MSDIIFFIGRVLVVIVMVTNGVAHLTKERPVKYAEFKKIPSAALAVRVSGICMLLGAVGIVLGALGDLAALLSALLMLIITITLHNFWTLEDEQARATDQSHFLKNLALIGGLLVIAWAFSNGGGINLIAPVWAPAA